jgi:haloalkane dehalogenase
MNKIIKFGLIVGAVVGAGVLLKKKLDQGEDNVIGTANGRTILRTPESRFYNLPGYRFASQYLEVEGLRMHYVDEGPREGQVILMLHGEPSWSYLYRKMIPIFVDAGYRAVAPDLIGFGKSDKIAEKSAYSYQQHVDWTWEWLQAVDLKNITLICQDWGSLIGLRLVAEHPERFARVVLSNGGLPTGDRPMGKAFQRWLTFSQKSPVLPIGRILQMGTQAALSKETLAAYEAPFPSEAYKAAARIFPALVPATPDDPATLANRQAWRSLHKFGKPFLTAFGDSDPISRGGDIYFQEQVPGAAGQAHKTIPGAGHFIQEDKGEHLAKVTLDFIAANPL